MANDQPEDAGANLMHDALSGRALKEYLVVFINPTMQIVDPDTPTADYGSLHELTDDDWRVFNVGNWMLTTHQLSQKSMLLSIITLERDKIAGRDTELKPKANQTFEQAAEESSRILKP